VLEDDLNVWNLKNEKARKQNVKLYSLNIKLVKNIKSLKTKIVEIKERYNKRVKKAQRYGVNALEMTLPRFDTELTEDYKTETIGREIDDYGSNDSCDGNVDRDFRAYRDPTGDTIQITDNGSDYKQTTSTINVLEQNDYYDMDEVTSGKGSIVSKSCMYLFLQNSFESDLNPF